MTLQNNKSLGQHWLKDRIILDEIAAEALLTGFQPLCLEIGPGLGTLTSALLRVFPKVLAVEFDEKLAKNLPKSFPGKDLTVEHADILKFDFSKLREPYVVAGNIPYYITSPIITKLLSAEPKPKKIVLLIQKEVADRILATPGDHTYLSLSVENRATVSPGIIVPRDFFTPPPKVDSATVILTPRETPLVSDDVMNLIKLGFSSPRKKLLKNLSGLNLNKTTFSRDDIEAIFEKLNLDKNSRPADLSLADWSNLYQALK